MIGDKISDIAAGEAAGVKSILVAFGYGAVEASGFPGRLTVPNVEDLREACRFIPARC